MADPVTATLAVGMAAQGAAGAYGQAQAQKQAGRFESQQLAFNARLAEMRAKDAISRGEREAGELGKQTRKQIGSQRAGFASQNVRVGTGSALEIEEETAALGALDQMTIRNNAWREAWGYRVEAADLTGRSAFARISGDTQARQTLLAGGLQAARDVMPYRGAFKRAPSGSKPSGAISSRNAGAYDIRGFPSGAA